MPEKPIALVVDDEARMRELERRILETGPYTVIEASGAPEAFRILAGGQRLDLEAVSLLLHDTLSADAVTRATQARPCERHPDR